jgi:predicted aconitase with swiveling domain
LAVKVNSNAVYESSEDIVAREIEGEIIIVPLVRGIGDAEEDLFSLNETGRAFWKLLDGKRTLAAIVAELEKIYAAPPGGIKKDIHGLATELLKRRIIRETK